MTRGGSAILHLPLLALALALLVWTEWHTDEVTVVLALLLVLAGALGFVRPGAAAATGIAIGLAVPLAHAIGRLAGIHPAYETAPPSSVDWLVMGALVVPALAAAYAGAWARDSASVAH